MGNLLDELEYVTICDECETLATVSMSGNEIAIVKCACTKLFSTPENN
jgi:hypothetical protein